MTKTCFLAITLAAMAFLTMTGVAQAQAPVSCSTVGAGSGSTYYSDCSTITSAVFSGQCTTSASSYKMTMKAMRLRRSSDSTFFTIATGSTTFDAASVSAGATIGAFASGADVEQGTYDAISPILDTSWSFAASTTGGSAGSCATSAAGVTPGSVTAVEQAVDMAALFIAYPDYQPSDLTISGSDVTIVDTEQASLPVTVAANQAMTIDVQFDVSSAAEFSYAAGTCNGTNLGQLGVTITFTTN